jgi:hypothetical protein
MLKSTWPKVGLVTRDNAVFGERGTEVFAGVPGCEPFRPITGLREAVEIPSTTASTRTPLHSNSS